MFSLLKGGEDEFGFYVRIKAKMIGDKGSERDCLAEAGERRRCYINIAVRLIIMQGTITCVFHGRIHQHGNLPCEDK